MNKNVFKLTIIAVLLITASINVNAQWFMGGKVGLSVHRGNANETINNTDRTTDFTQIGFSIAPKGGYYFNEKFALGLSFNVGGTFKKVKEEEKSDTWNVEKKSWNDFVNWGVYPFVRYPVFTYKKFSVLLEGYTGVGFTHYLLSFREPIEAKAIDLTISVFNLTPLLSFKLNDRLQMEAGLQFLNVGYNIDIIKRDIKENEELSMSPYKLNSTKHDFNIGFNSGSVFTLSHLTFGVVYKF